MTCSMIDIITKVFKEQPRSTGSVNYGYKRQQISWLMRILAPLRKAKKWGKGPASPRKSPLNVVLPHHGTPYSLWTCPTEEHTTHSGPAPPRSTLLTVDLPHHGTPYTPLTYSMLNTII